MFEAFEDVEDDVVALHGELGFLDAEGFAFPDAGVVDEGEESFMIGFGEISFFHRFTEYFFRIRD